MANSSPRRFRLSTLYDAGDVSDIVLICPELGFRKAMHRVCLLEKCSYFRAAFIQCRAFLPAQTTVPLQGVPAEYTFHLPAPLAGDGPWELQDLVTFFRTCYMSQFTAERDANDLLHTDGPYVSSLLQQPIRWLRIHRLAHYFGHEALEEHLTGLFSGAFLDALASVEEVPQRQARITEWLAFSLRAFRRGAPDERIDLFTRLTAWALTVLPTLSAESEQSQQRQQLCHYIQHALGLGDTELPLSDAAHTRVYTLCEHCQDKVRSQGYLILTNTDESVQNVHTLNPEEGLQTLPCNATCYDHRGQLVVHLPVETDGGLHHHHPGYLGRCGQCGCLEPLLVVAVQSAPRSIAPCPVLVHDDPMET